LSGAVTEAHWDAVTHFLDLVASQGLVIQDEGVSIQSAPQSPVSDDIPKFSNNFANLIQEQKCAEKYSVSDCDGTTAKGGLARVPKVQEYSGEDEMFWPREEQKIHLEITEKDVQQRNLNNEAEVLKNVVGKAHEIVLDSERNGKQDLVQKFGIFNHDEGWRPETCEETHKVATVSKCGQQQQRRRKIGHVTETLNLHYMLQQLKQQASRTEEVVAVLHCQECEQTRHMSSEKGGIAPRASNLQCKQVPSETVADVNCNLCGVRKVLGVNQNCGVESLCRVVDCQNQPSRLHWTVSDNSSLESFIDGMCSCQEELSKFHPQWQIIERERSGCASERVRQSFTCQVSGMSCVNGSKQGIPSQSMGHYCSCVSQSNETNIGHLPSAQESAGNLHIRNQHQQVFADCERCELEVLSPALVQVPGSDEGMKYIWTQPQTPGQDVMSVCYRGLLEQELSKVENQNSFQIPEEVTTLGQNCQPQCNLCDIHSYYHNAYLVNNSLQSQIGSCDRNFNDEQKNQSFHQSIHFPHISQHGNEQQMLLGYGWDQRMRSTSAPVSARRLPECQAKASICHSRISRSGTPVNGPSQTKDQVNAPVWQRCELQKRNFQTGSPKRNEMCIKCHEETMGCQESELQKQKKSPEIGEGIDCQQCELEKRVFRLGTPEGMKMLVNGQEYTMGRPECELQKQIIQGTGFRQCEFGKRVSQNVSPERNRVCFRCQDSPLEKQVVTPEVDQVSVGRQGVAAPSAEDKIGVESWSQEATSECHQERTISWESFRRQYREGLEEGVHHKKKRAVALWQRLLRKHVISNVKRKPISVHPSLSSASEP
jgi:hypothetical protein